MHDNERNQKDGNQHIKSSTHFHRNEANVDAGRLSKSVFDSKPAFTALDTSAPEASVTLRVVLDPRWILSTTFVARGSRSVEGRLDTVGLDSIHF